MTPTETIVLSIFTALLSGALVAFLNGTLQQMRDEKALYRSKAEIIFIAMNRIVAYHSMIGSALADIVDQNDVDSFLETYKLYGTWCREIFAEDAVLNTQVSIYFRECVGEQEKVSEAVKTLWYQALSDAQAARDLERSQMVQRKVTFVQEIASRYDKFNDAAVALDAKLLQALDRIELANSWCGAIFGLGNIIFEQCLRNLGV